MDSILENVSILQSLFTGQAVFFSDTTIAANGACFSPDGPSFPCSRRPIGLWDCTQIHADLSTIPPPLPYAQMQLRTCWKIQGFPPTTEVRKDFWKGGQQYKQWHCSKDQRMRAWPTRPWEITWHNQRSNQKTKDYLIAMHMRPSLSLINYFRVLKTSFIKGEKGK